MKRTRYDVDVLDTESQLTFVYTVSAPSPSHAIGSAVKMHGESTAQWAGNVRLAAR